MYKKNGCTFPVFVKTDSYRASSKRNKEKYYSRQSLISEGVGHKKSPLKVGQHFQLLGINRF
jgi:hypothetical protein